MLYRLGLISDLSFICLIIKFQTVSEILSNYSIYFVMSIYQQFFFIKGGASMEKGSKAFKQVFE